MLPLSASVKFTSRYSPSLGTGNPENALNTSLKNKPVNRSNTQELKMKFTNLNPPALCIFFLFRLFRVTAIYLGVFGINTASYISKFTKLSRAAAARIFGEY